MASWTSLALLSALAVSALSSPRPDDKEYKIPQVGTGRRSQYYVLHNDGTFKYGYDTGEGAYEVAKQKTPRVQHGKFGYRDQDGNDVRLEYQAGEGGFQPSGTHIPSASPEFYAAHAEAQARPPFRDPLADSNTDASYGFRFAEDGLSRTEQSDADGNVRGSYAYTDEEGKTRSYTYTAGRGVGFVIEGSDLPQAPLAPGDTPASTRLSSGAGAAAAAAAAASFRGSTSQTSQAPSATSFGGSTSFGALRTGFRQPTVQSGAHGGSAFRSATAVGSYGSRRTPVTQTSTHGASTFHSSTASGAGATYRAPTSSQRQSTTFGATKYTGELANTRTSLGSDGSRSFAYETSSHSRSEAEDSDDNVVGNFDFVAPDDGQRRAVRYEASRDTGFIAEGAHIPVGPAVPGAPSGQPTGRIVPVQEVPFVDPLADSGTDASYGFAFDSEQYSRSETADADGNVQGTYTVVDDDGTRRTYRFRAGKGIGFETEEVSTSRGPRPSRPSTTAGSSSFTSTSTSATHGAASPSPVVSYSSPSSGRFSTSYRTGSSTGTGASSTTGTSFGTRTSFGTGTSAGRGSSFGAGTSARTGTSTVGGTSYKTGASAGRGASFQTGTSYRTGTTSKVSHSGASPLRSPFTPTASREVFPGFQLHQYDATDNSDKYGYVLKFDR
ncbi:putative per-hexamer repeat protein 5 [Eriocheir sinensis]|uniref:putative per-hexamer repeat protein 5 n=1 Tax=Eriocheir sinensis TaxID=95602 RepID=UPI0021C60A5A|nr:putative per-hexamer repeat protein 5 [Eriocheir sinensis]